MRPLLILGMTNTQDWAAKVDRAANDPEHIKRRKDIAPAFTVPRYRELEAAEWHGEALD